MSWFSKTLNSTIGRKIFMSLTGIFLILFLTVHVAGNLQLLIPDGGKAFNIYAHTMGTNPFIQVVSKLNFAFIIVHIIWSILLTRQNMAARGVGYAASSGASSKWNSRNMGALGTVILIFLIVHLRKFWYVFKFGEVPTTTIDGAEVPNYFLVVNEAYSYWYYVVFYVVCLIVIAGHLNHGFQSAFQTLGLNHKKYTPFIKAVGALYSIIVPLLFALIPVMMFLRNL